VDPIVATVIWLVVWLVLAGVFSWLGVLIGIAFGWLFEEVFQFEGALVFVVPVGWFLGWVGVGWAVVQIILHIIDLLRETGIIHA
jgi:hypothetical protein